MSGGTIGSMAFTFSHANAAIMLFGNNASSERTKRSWIPIYNATFVVYPLIWLGVILVGWVCGSKSLREWSDKSRPCLLRSEYQSQAIKIVVADRRIYGAAQQFIPLLDSVIANPTSLTPAIHLQLQSLLAIITENVPTVINQRKAITLLGLIYCVLFACIGSGGLWLIRILRQSECAILWLL